MIPRTTTHPTDLRPAGDTEIIMHLPIGTPDQIAAARMIAAHAADADEARELAAMLGIEVGA